MYELLVLSLLMHWPLYAYLIAEIANHILGPWEHISRGTLSSLLTKLEQAGYIAPADPAQVPFSTDRPSRVFAITPAGRERFYQIMMDTTSKSGHLSTTLSHQGAAPGVRLARRSTLPGGSLPELLPDGFALPASRGAGFCHQSDQTSIRQQFL